MRTIGVSSAFIWVLIGCGGDPAFTPLEPGAVILEGEAELARPGGGLNSVRSRAVLFVGEDGVPTHIRDEHFGAEHGVLHELTFGAGEVWSEPIEVASGPVGGRCSLRVDRASGCAELTYEECWRLHPRSDSALVYDGTIALCATDEAFVPRVRLVGASEPSTLMPDGRLGLDANYPLEPGLDEIELTFEGETRTWPIDARGLGPVPFGASFEARFVGERSGVDFAHATPLATTEVQTDLSLEDVALGALDCRGERFEAEDGTLRMVRTTGPEAQPAFVHALALEAPPVGASALALEYTEDTENRTRGQLVRADGTAGAMSAARSLELPAGEGPVWLVLWAPPPNALTSRFGAAHVLHSLAWTVAD